MHLGIGNYHFNGTPLLLPGLGLIKASLYDEEVLTDRPNVKLQHRRDLPWTAELVIMLLKGLVADGLREEEMAEGGLGAYPSPQVPVNWAPVKCNVGLTFARALIGGHGLLVDEPASFRVKGPRLLGDLIENLTLGQVSFDHLLHPGASLIHGQVKWNARWFYAEHPNRLTRFERVHRAILAFTLHSDGDGSYVIPS
jgi:hypothetical protein